MWELDDKEGWVLKNRCFWTVVLEKTLESPLDCKEIKLVNLKGNEPWVFIGRTEGPILWPPDAKNWYFWTMVLEKTLESPVDCKEIKLVNPKGNCPENIHWKDWCWSWNSKLWPPEMKSWLTGKDPDAGKDWRREKGTTEDEMLRWHHWPNGHEFA